MTHESSPEEKYTEKNWLKAFYRLAKELSVFGGEEGLHQCLIILDYLFQHQTKPLQVVLTPDPQAEYLQEMRISEKYRGYILEFVAKNQVLIEHKLNEGLKSHIQWFLKLNSLDTITEITSDKVYLDLDQISELQQDEKFSDNRNTFNMLVSSMIGSLSTLTYTIGPKAALRFLAEFLTDILNKKFILDDGEGFEKYYNNKLSSGIHGDIRKILKQYVNSIILLNSVNVGKNHVRDQELEAIINQVKEFYKSIPISLPPLTTTTTITTVTVNNEQSFANLMSNFYGSNSPRFSASSRRAEYEEIPSERQDSHNKAADDRRDVFRGPRH